MYQFITESYYKTIIAIILYIDLVVLEVQYSHLRLGEYCTSRVTN